eukprot:m51a1_g8494 putative s-adenosylmethionine-dependent methyltransferase superfamily domain-containing protein (525) ;mRNA; r:27525-29591
MTDAEMPMLEDERAPAAAAAAAAAAPATPMRDDEDNEGDDDKEWGGWVEESDASETAPCACPVCAAAFPGARAALAHAASAHGVDLLAIRRVMRLDTLGWARLVNGVRRDRAVPASFAADDSLLIPVVADDPLLTMAHDEDFEEDEDEAAPEAVVARLRRENEELRRAALKVLVGEDSDDEGGAAKTAARGDEKVDVRSDYFQSYERLCIHEEMLRDAARTGAYHDFFKRASKALIQGRAVADVGAGTGVLSIMAARAGASKVFGIEASQAADLAEKVIADNGETAKIELVRGAAEEVQLPTKVDVIVSEWMGYCLLYENMLESVLAFRDKWLAPGGCVQPSHAVMWASAIERPAGAHESRAQFFSSNDYGIDFSSLRPLAYTESSIEVVDPDELVGEPCRLVELDLNTLPRTGAHDLTFAFEQRVARRLRGVHGVVVWFDCEFRWAEEGREEAVVLSTSPGSEPTHWKQCVVEFEEALAPCDVATTLSGSLAIKRHGERGLLVDVVLSSSARPDVVIHRSYHV